MFKPKCLGYLASATLIFWVLSVVLFVPNHANALGLGARSLNLSTTEPLATATDTITFALPNDPENSNIKSIMFLYCTDPGPGVISGQPSSTQGCTEPTGIDASGAVLDSQSGATNFAIESTTTNEIILSDPASEDLSGKTVQFSLGNMINPGEASQPTKPYGTFFVRIAVFQDTDASDPYTDYGAVASGTGSVSVSTEVPPILDFCVGVSIAKDCSQTTGNLLQFGSLSTITTARAVSQFAIGTNAGSGASVTANGSTMTSGNNTIAALGSPTASLAGSPQFGINLRANSNPAFGHNPTGNGSITPTADYDSPDLFKFQSGDVIAHTSTTSNFETFSVSYIVNIAHNQPDGVYDTTITYICTANF